LGKGKTKFNRRIFGWCISSYRLSWTGR